MTLPSSQQLPSTHCCPLGHAPWGFEALHALLTQWPWLQSSPVGQAWHAAPCPPQALSAVPELQVLPTQQPAQVWAQPWVGAAHAASTQLSPVEQAWQALPPAPQALDSVPGLQVPS